MRRKWTKFDDASLLDAHSMGIAGGGMFLRLYITLVLLHYRGLLFGQERHCAMYYFKLESSNETWKCYSREEIKEFKYAASFSRVISFLSTGQGSAVLPAQPSTCRGDEGRRNPSLGDE